jgi:hypothetical protein
MNLPLEFFRDNVHRALTLTDEQATTVMSALDGADDRHVIRARPYADGPGREYAEEVISTFHSTVTASSWLDRVTSGETDDPDRFSYELWYHDNQLEFIWTVPNDYWYDEIRNVLTGHYPRLSLNRVGATLPTFDRTDSIAGGTFTLYNNQFIPLKPTSGHGQFDPEKPPLRLVTSEVAGQPDTTAVVQVMFEPAPEDWRTTTGLGGRDADTVASHLKDGTFVDSFLNPRVEDPTEKDHRIARAIHDHEGDPAFAVTIRYLVFAPTAEQAQNQAASIGNAYRNTFYNKALNQRLTQQPLNDGRLVDELRSCISREHSGNTMQLTIPELAAVAHIPNSDVDTPSISWTRRALTSRAPSEAPRKPETIDPRPYHRFGPDTRPEDHLSATAPQLPPADGAPADPPPDPSTPDDPAPAAADATELTDSPTDATTETYQRYGRPQDRVSDGKQREFDRIVRGVQTGDLTLEEINDQYGGGPEAENLITLIEQELEWRDTGHDDDAPPPPEHAPPDDNSVGRPTGAPNNLPTKPGDYDDYHFTPSGFQREWMKDPHTKDDRAYEVAVRHDTPDGDDAWYIGRDVKNELFDSHTDHPDAPIWLGWMHDNRVGVREIGVPKTAWFRHMTLFGMTGTGKSTFENNVMNQIARKGHGFVYIDPKGDGVKDVIQQLPEHRLDDIIWVEPGSIHHDKVVGINFLEPAYDEDDPKYDREVASIVDDLVAILKGGDYWGPKMQGITTNFARAMIRSNINYTLLDMYYVLLSKEARLAFAEIVNQEREKRIEAGETGGFVQDMANIEQYTKQIAAMDQEEVDAVVRRIQHWIEDPISRGVVAHREGTVNLTDAVERGQIILVSIDIDSQDIKEVVTTAIMRRVWAAIKARDEDEHDRDPFFAFIDEFDDVVTPEMDIEKMLSKARSGKMSVNLACQNPSQIPAAPLDQMFNNARTLNSFNIGGPDDAALISKRLGDDVEASQVTEIPQYTIYTRVLIDTEDGYQLSDPLALNTFADYPPQRTRREAHDVIDASLERHGVDPLEETLEESSMILYNWSSDVNIQRGLLQSIWEIQIQRDAEYVAMSAVDEAFTNRVGHSIEQYPEGLTIDTDWVELYRPAGDDTDTETVVADMNAGDGDRDAGLADGGYTQVAGDAAGEIQLSELRGVIRVTEEGTAEVLRSEDHRVSPSDTHSELLERGAFEWFTRAGFTVSIMEQVKDDSVADAVGQLPVESTGVSLGEAQQSLAELEAEYPFVAELSGGREVAIEAEVSLSKPAGPLKNLARAVNNNQRPVFLVPDGRREDLLPSRVESREFGYWARRLHNVIYDPLMVRHFSTYEDDAGTTHTARTLYNTQEHLSLSTDGDEQKFPLLQKGKQCVWQDHDGEYLILYDGAGDDGNQRGRVTPETLDDASANAFETWCRYDQYDEEWVVYPEKRSKIIYQSLDELKDDWQRVYRPFHPETDIDGDPAAIDPLITILREPEHIERLEEAMPAVYQHPYDTDTAQDEPEVRPLIPEEYRRDWDPDLIPGFTPVEQTPSFLDDDGESVRGRLAAEFGDTQLMTSDITGIDDVASATDELPDYDPSHEPQYDFGGNDPTTRGFWVKVWEHHGQLCEEPLELDPLRDGLLDGAALPTESHEPAIIAGVRSGQLLPSDIGYFLAPPTRRPAVIVGDPSKFVRRSVWEDIWRKNKLDEDDTVPRQVIEHGALGLGPFTGEQAEETVVRAAIELAIADGVLEPTDDGALTLGPPEIPEKWQTVWDKCGAEIDAPVERHYAAMVLRGTAGLESVDAADDHIQAALDKHVLSETEAGLRINHPTTIDGPSHTPDDDDNDDAGDTDGAHDSPAPNPRADTDTASDGPNESSADEDADGAAPGSDGHADGTDAAARAPGPDTGPDTDGGSDVATVAPDDDPTDQGGPDGAVRVAVGAAVDSDVTPAPGADDPSTPAAARERTSPADFGPIERWDLTPTDQAPAGWQDAFAAAVDVYHDYLEATIDANVAWNELIADYRDRHHQSAACAVHDTYVAACQDCQLTAACTSCPDAATKPIRRVEWESCGEHDALPAPDCPACQERQYCLRHARDRRDDTGVASDPAVADGGPAEYIELVTCYRCDEYTPAPDRGDRCYCQAHTHVGPLQRLPETAAEYFTGPDWEADDTFTHVDYADTEDPHRHRGAAPDTIGRGWTQDVVDDRRLGWIPGTKPYEKPVIESLLSDGYTVEQLLATGLFRPHLREISRSLTADDDPTAITAADIATDPDIDLTAALEDDATPLEPRDVLQPRWSGRPIFPAFNQDGAAVYAYARRQPGRQHPHDTQSAKYLKLPDKAYIHATEPIYGADTLEADTPAIITEGVADAIAAYSHGFPVLSPVTVQFKDAHHAPLLALLDAYDIDVVLIIQDNEPGSFSVLADDAVDTAAIETAMADRERWLDSDSQAIAKHIAAGEGRGPIGEAMEIDGVGPGLSGALATGEFLQRNGVMALQVELPRFGADKVDLDDYLTSGLCAYAPPLPSFQAFVDGLDPGQEQTIVQQLQEANAFTDYYATAVEEYLDAHAVPAGSPPQEWPAFETIAAWDDARRELRESALLSAGPHAADDFDLEPVASAEGPSTFTRGFPGRVLELGGIVVPVPALARRPRGTRLTLCISSGDDGASGGPRVADEWVLEVTDRHETAVSLVETDAGKAGFFTITPLFDGPTIERPDAHTNFEHVMRDRARNEHAQLTDHASGSTDAAGGRSRNPLFALSLHAVAGVDDDYRGPNPLGHTGDSQDYFVVYDGEVAIDYKRNAVYNALTYLAVDAGVRDIRHPSGRFDDAELLETWLYAKRDGILGPDAPVPLRALNAAAIDMGIASPSELVSEKEVRTGDASIVLSDGLPDDLYNETLREFPDVYGVSPGKTPMVTEADVRVGDLDPETSLTRFGEMFLEEHPERGPDPDFSVPRVSSNVCWNAYQAWCSINDIEPQPQREIQRMVTNVDAEKKRAKIVIDGEKTTRACFTGVHLDDRGWWLYHRHTNS